MDHPNGRTDAAIAVIRRGGQILICQRPLHVALGGLWEFPGGKREPGETIEQCLHREVLEELAIHIRLVHALTPLDHDYPHASVRLHPFICTIESGQVQNLHCQTSRWIDPTDFGNYHFPPANEPLLEQIIVYMSGRERSFELP